MQTKLLGTLLVVCMMVTACSKSSTKPTYFFTFHYLDLSYSMDSSWCSINGNQIVINAYDTKTTSPLAGNIREQYLKFNLTDSGMARTGDYYNVPGAQSISRTEFALFTSYQGNAGVGSGVALYDSIPSLHLTITSASATDVYGTFEKNDAISDSVIFLRVTNGKFHLPIR